jgi:hypothetical protein
MDCQHRVEPGGVEPHQRVRHDVACGGLDEVLGEMAAVSAELLPLMGLRAVAEAVDLPAEFAPWLSGSVDMPGFSAP